MATAVTNSITDAMGAVTCISHMKVYSLYSLKYNFGREDALLLFRIFTDHALRQGESPDLLPWHSEAVCRSELHYNLRTDPRSTSTNTLDQNSFPHEMGIYQKFQTGIIFKGP